MSLDHAFLPDKEQMRRAFDKAAGQYDTAALLQREVNQRMFERLDYIKLQPQQVLDAGAGTGYATRLLQGRYPQAQLFALDIALGMLQQHRPPTPSWQARFGWRKALSYHCICADIEAMPLASNSVDLLWSNLTLQWIAQPDTALQEMYRVLRPDGLLMFSSLGPDTLRELRQSFAQVDSLPHVNQFIDMHDIGDALVRTGFVTPVMDMEVITITYQDLKLLLQDLKAIGAHNVAQGRARGMMGKRAWQTLQAAYEAFRRADGLLPASYEVIYGHAWKAQPKIPAPQTIQFYPHRPT